MNSKVTLTILAGLLLLGYATSLECYTCSTEDDGHGNGDHCSEEDPDTHDMDRFISVDHDRCEVCYKASYEDSHGDHHTMRGCMDEDTFDDVHVDVDHCETVDYLHDDTDMCICDHDKCNGSGALAVSLATILFSAFLKYML